MMSAPIQTILFVGDLNKGTRSYQRYKTMQSFGCNVIGISWVAIGEVAGSVITSIRHKLGVPRDATNTNENILITLKGAPVDIVWVEKGATLLPNTLKHIRKSYPHIKIISCTEDNMYLRHNHSWYYRFGLRYYDIVFTTKPQNLCQLKRFGARRVELFQNSFNEDTHWPVVLTDDDVRTYASSVSFVGTWERDRARSILFLAQNGVAVTVWGNGWRRYEGIHPNVIIKGRPVMDDEYRKVVCASTVNLCFLRKMNFDAITSRSIEIPACRGFMLAERTRAHRELFIEDRDAVYFDSMLELYDKTVYYLNNPEERERIASCGFQRCHELGLSTRHQLEKMFALTS